MREEIQKTFAQSQDQVARTHKVKEECMKLLNHTEESPQTLAQAINQEKLVVAFLKNLQNTLEASNGQLFSKLNFLKTIVNNENSLSYV